MGKLKNIHFPKVIRVLVYSKNVDKYFNILQSVVQLSENPLRDDIGVYTSRMLSPQYCWSFGLYCNIYSH